MPAKMMRELVLRDGLDVVGPAPQVREETDRRSRRRAAAAAAPQRSPPSRPRSQRRTSRSRTAGPPRPSRTIEVTFGGRCGPIGFAIEVVVHHQHPDSVRSHRDRRGQHRVSTARPPWRTYAPITQSRGRRTRSPRRRRAGRRRARGAPCTRRRRDADEAERQDDEAAGGDERQPEHRRREERHGERARERPLAQEPGRDDLAPAGDDARRRMLIRARAPVGDLVHAMREQPLDERAEDDGADVVPDLQRAARARREPCRP